MRNCFCTHKWSVNLRIVKASLNLRIRPWRFPCKVLKVVLVSVLYPVSIMCFATNERSFLLPTLIGIFDWFNLFSPLMITIRLNSTMKQTFVTMAYRIINIEWMRQIESSCRCIYLVVMTTQNGCYCLTSIPLSTNVDVMGIRKWTSL